MLKRLHLKNFTVFADADFEFGPGLNVLVGTNGTGKSHVLKVGYAVLYNAVDRLRKLRNSFVHSTHISANESVSSRFDFIYLEEKLSRLFRPVPNKLSELIRRGAMPSKATIRFEIGGVRDEVGNIIFESGQSEGSSFENLSPESVLRLNDTVAAPVIIPAKEVLTLSWLRAAATQLKIGQTGPDDTYLDLLNQLSGLPLQNPKATVASVLRQLAVIIGGEVKEEADVYYLVSSGEMPLEMNMVAEGLRKFAMLFKLLANGSINAQATLFWDEPEANMNPALLRKLAAILAELARQGFQIILATHSMSLLKEFHILSREPNKEKLLIKYFGLNARPGEATTVVTTDDFEYLPDVVALEVELEQADDLEEIFVREDQQRHADNR